MGRPSRRWNGLLGQLGLASSVLLDELDAVHHTDIGSHVCHQRISLAALLTHDPRFMDSLQWVDQTYVQKHKSEDPTTLRAMYYPNLKLYTTHGDTSKHRAPMDAALAFLIRFGRRAGISLAIYALSYLPYVGRFVLPAASFYTFNKAVGPIPAVVIFGSGIFLPRRYLVIFLQSYFSSRSLMRELVMPPLLPLPNH